MYPLNSTIKSWQVFLEIQVENHTLNKCDAAQCNVKDKRRH